MLKLFAFLMAFQSSVFASQYYCPLNSPEKVFSLDDAYIFKAQVMKTWLEKTEGVWAIVAEYQLFESYKGNPMKIGVVKSLPPWDMMPQLIVPDVYLFVVTKSGEIYGCYTKSYHNSDPIFKEYKALK